jgi:hypothetical protein
MGMMTFESFVKSGYLAYSLTGASRNDLLHRFKPKNPEVICQHVTFKFPAKSSDELPPAAHEAHVVGYAEEDGLEALVVEINGHTKRPSDGKLFHITLSLDRKKGKKPVHSNALVGKGFKHIPPISIHLEPAFLQ